jgi:[ribosomal protein S5]-alanine N-acetyltransferase
MARIRIRPITEKDALAVQAYASHELVAATCNVPHPYPDDGAISFIRQALENPSTAFVFAVLADETFVGIASINNVTNPDASISIDFGIAVPFWNKGYATAAVREAICYARDKLNVKSVENSCLRENIGSRRVMEKNGFRKVGEKPYDGPRMDRFKNRMLDIYRRDLRE